MKQFLKKPLGLAVAATMAIGGMSAYTNATAAVDANALGDLALVPYYTVRDNFVTGVHIINTSDQTQVVKMRLRRGSDSADALDFNIIMSPYDVWVGTINDDDDALGITSTDNTCTAPVANGTDSLGRPKFVAPAIFAANNAADEGYLEVIGMAQADETQPISVGALHGANGMPADCDAVRANFRFANGTGAVGVASTATRGVLSNSLTRSNAGTLAAAQGDSDFTGTDNVLKVSYFIRDSQTGMEMGDNATHIVDFVDDATAAGAMMTNQEFGINSGDVTGFDFPDLNGGSLLNGVGIVGPAKGRYDASIRESLGSDAILNDWSFNSANGVSTDWVVTIPGQYTMDNPADNGSVIIDGSADLVDHRDLPVRATFEVFDREEATAVAEDGGLVISPSPFVENPTTDFTRETNVIEWGGKTVFNTVAPTAVSTGLVNTTGWANLTIASTKTIAPAVDTRVIYDQTDRTGAANEPQAGWANQGVPVIGFTAWQRTFTDASKNYGRIVAHSRVNPTP
ncbi:hypothetical protein OO007_01730 [Cocleimonas sp. KMM 6892]|uniref:hypothetical protein n=1 Tax=unclassified Cocleimonas TaxID=2639732 RepID=UPI002DB70CEC|nr:MULTISPECIES: hypothetical protein [unclassified Cocleimonas]MEB8430928.1 hypothetical protein [Cocleimonas sp. KMM 6892]MEC4714300.1 hypothetical protein [Cocleimonas sp. KMM 6895]MEC4743631.1 hypothetical protein [Cocleimonas sp. KMM 6896]